MGYSPLFIRRIYFHPPFRIPEILYASSIPLNLQCKVLDDLSLPFCPGTWRFAFDTMFDNINDNGSIPPFRKWRIGRALDGYFITNLRG